MAVCYLEIDDEITTAIGRIRAVTGPDAVLVVPSGSRVATSRINFRLLAREAAERRMNVVAVSDEPQVRALAISAGLPAYDSISAAEQALATFREQGRVLSQPIDRTMPREEPPSQAVPAVPIDTAILPAHQVPAGRGPRQRSRGSLMPLVVLSIVVLLVAAVGYGALVFLPTASITVRPAATRVQAPAIVVTADPSVAVVDPLAGVIPAQQVSVPLHVEGTFNATGIDAHDVKATGTVRFRSENTLNAVTIPASTTLATAAGEDFTTIQDVDVPRASFESGPATAEVGVRAAKGGIRGNVAAGAIAVVPALFANQLITVMNPDATSGGKHVEDHMISDTDYSSAVTALSQQLMPRLATTLTDSGSVPGGLVAFAETAQMSAGQPDQTAEQLVGIVASTFALALDATADVTAVNESLIDDVAAVRVRAALRAGQTLLGDDVTVTHDGGTVIGDTVSFAVQASGLAYSDVDAQTLINSVRGKSLAEARATLASIGNADISVWPDFVDHLPDQAGRISVIVVTPSPRPSAAPTSRPSSPAAATPRPSAS